MQEVKQNGAWVTRLLVLINVLVFAIAWFHASKLAGGNNLYLQDQLNDIAARYGLRADNLQISTFFTSMFLHLEPLHLVLNMLFLYFFGSIAENTMGHLRFAVFYFGCGLAAELLHIPITTLFFPEQLHVPVPTLGASGAIAGILGFSAIRFIHIKINLWKSIEISASAALIAWLGWQLIGGIFSVYNPQEGQGVAYWAHIGGFLFGMVLGILLANISVQKEPHRLASEADIAKFLSKKKGSESERLEYHMRLGETASQLGEDERALGHYRKAFDIAQKSDSDAGMLAVYESAVNLLGHFDLDAAQGYKMGLLFERVGKIDQSLEVLKSVYKKNPQEDEGLLAQVRTAKILLEKKDSPQEALDILKDFQKDNPDSFWRPYAQQILDQVKQRLHAKE